MTDINKTILHNNLNLICSGKENEWTKEFKEVKERFTILALYGSKEELSWHCDNSFPKES